MADAIRKREIEPEVARLRVELARLDRPEEATASEGWLASGWAWILGLGVVIVATFGTVIFARVDVVVTATANDSKVPALSSGAVPAEPSDGDKIVDWVRAFRRQHGRNPMIPELQAQFPGTPKTTAWRRSRVA